MDVIGGILSDFGGGLSYLGQFNYWAAFLFAVFVTVPIALIPGVSATLVMAVMIPFIVISVEDPVLGIVMLATLTGIDNTLDSIPSILLGIPGGATQVTFLEGNQLAQRGQAAHTLGAVYAVSAIGGVVGALTLAVIIPVIAPFVLAFEFAEKAAMAIFGVAMVAALSGGALIKGFVAALLGLLISTIGPSGLDFRYSFGQSWLMFSRLDLIVISIGIFALPEIIDLTMTRKPLAPKDAKISYNEIFRGARYGFSRWPMAIRQSLFGVFLGAVPGIGSGVVDWMSYAFGIFWTKDKSQFGKGSLDGVLFAESAQNSKEGGQAVPTLALGIPGGRAWAFVIVALAAYGLAPGPRMLEERGDITIMIVLSLGLGNLMVTMLGLGFTRQMARLTLIPYPVIGFLVVSISLLASYLRLIDISAITMVLIGAVLGMLMKRYRWPRPPMLIGVILGPIIETNLRDSVSVYDWWGTFTRPIFIVLVVVAIVVGALFLRFMSGGASAMQELDVEAKPPAPAGGSGTEGSMGIGARLQSLRWRWTEDQLLTGALIVAVVYAIYEASRYSLLSFLPGFPLGDGGFSEFGRWFPNTLAWIALPLLAAQFVREGLGSKTGNIMDIGVRSRGMEGARTAGLIFVFMLASFMAIAGLMTEGLKWGAVYLATVGPMLMMQNRLGVIGGVLSGVIVMLLTLVFFDFLVGLLWPQPFMREWPIINSFFS